MGQQGDEAGGATEADEFGIEVGVLGENREGFDIGVEVGFALDEFLGLGFELGAHLGIARYALLEGKSGLAQPGGIEFIGWWWWCGPGICGGGCVLFVHIVQHLGFLRRDATTEEPTILIIVVIVIVVRVVRWRGGTVVTIFVFRWRGCRTGFYIFISGLLVVLLDARVTAAVAIGS